MEYYDSDTILNETSAQPAAFTQPAMTEQAADYSRPTQPDMYSQPITPAQPIVVPTQVPYAPDAYRQPAVNTYSVSRVETEKKNEKKHSGIGIVAIAVACAILGSIFGGAAAGYLLRNNSSVSKSVQEVLEKPKLQQTPVPGNENPVIRPVSPNDSSVSLTPAQIYDCYVDAVVGITNESTVTNIYGQITSAASCGSGVIISEDGYVLTNFHVVESSEKLTVSLHNKEEYDAELIGYDAANDVALLKINASDLTVAPLGDSDTLSIGDQVAAIGNPLGELDFTMTVGYISAKDREVNTDGNPINMMQTDAAINSGNSGGPLFDMHGNVIGITTAKYSGSTTTGTSIEGIGFAIPINDVKSIVNDLQTYGYVTGKPYLGITVGDIESAYMFYYDYPSSAYVNSVVPGSCADKAGLKKGDIITAVGDYMVRSYTDLVASLKHFKAGDQTTLSIYRNGEKVVLDITFDERTPEVESASPTETEPETEPEETEGSNPFGWFLP